MRKRIYITPRKEASYFLKIVLPFIAFFFTILFGYIILHVLGYPALETLRVYFISPLQDTYNFTEILIKSIPLILIALGLSFGFNSNIWNIGAEGQFIVGAIFGSVIALYFYQQESVWLLPLMFLVASIGGMLWASIPAVLKIFYNTNEILVSLMLNYVGLLLLSFLVHGPLRDPDGINFPESRIFHDSAVMHPLLEGTRLHSGIFVVLFIVILFYIINEKTFIGYQVKVFGSSVRAAKFSGFNSKKIVWLSFLITGGLSGMAGIMEVSGLIGQIHPQISSGYGYTAIIVAFLGKLHPIGIVFSGFIIALTFIGGEIAQIEQGVPLAITQIFQGILLFCLLMCEALNKYSIKITDA